MKKRKALPWLSIVKGWIQKPRALPYSRYNEYLPGRIRNYLMVDNLAIRQERLKALATLLVTNDMKGINSNFYELIEEEKFGSEANPFDIDWSKYDILTGTKEVSQ